MPPYLGVSGLFMGPGVSMPGLQSFSDTVHAMVGYTAVTYTLTNIASVAVAVHAMLAAGYPQSFAAALTTELTAIVNNGVTTPPWYL